MEKLSIVLAALGLIIAYATYHKTIKVPPPVFNAPEPKEEKLNLLAHFRMKQNISKDVQELLRKYIQQNNAGSREMFPNITYQKYLDTLTVEYEKCLSEKLYDDLKELLISKETIASMQDSISQQSNALLQIKISFC